MGEDGTVPVNGGQIIQVVEQGTSSGPSSQADLDAWIATYDLEITVVKPRDGVTTEQLEGREWVYIIDLSNNQIVYRAFGLSALNAGLEELDTLTSQ